MINRITLYIALGLVCAGLIGFSYWKVYEFGRATERASQAEAEDKAEQVRTVTETRIMRMPKNDVQKLLEAKWCRDCS